MTVFLDLYKTSKGEYVYPSVTIRMKEGENKIFPFVQSVYVDKDYVVVIQFINDEPHEVVVKEVEYFTVNNK